jgi:hypothetical protein
VRNFRGILVVAAGTVALLGGIAVTTASAQNARPVTVRHLGSCRTQGDFAICTASGSVNHPSSIHVHVSASPGQHVSGAWNVVCSKGTGAGSKSGTFSGHASVAVPLTHLLRQNYKHPDSCIAAADAQLGTGGHLHVWITARN